METKCYECRYCKEIKETRFSPKEYICTEDMWENLETGGGCYLWSEKEYEDDR